MRRSDAAQTGGSSGGPTTPSTATQSTQRGVVSVTVSGLAGAVGDQLAGILWVEVPIRRGVTTMSPLGGFAATVKDRLPITQVVRAPDPN